MDLTTLTDEELDEHRVDVLREQERRASLALIPTQVGNLADKYKANGGDAQELIDQISDRSPTNG